MTVEIFSFSIVLLFAQSFFLSVFIRRRAALNTSSAVSPLHTYAPFFFLQPARGWFYYRHSSVPVLLFWTADVGFHMSENKCVICLFGSTSHLWHCFGVKAHSTAAHVYGERAWLGRRALPSFKSILNFSWCGWRSAFIFSRPLS
jgi:hypothetical protein